jgi:hypothetical protein
MTRFPQCLACMQEELFQNKNDCLQVMGLEAGASQDFQERRSEAMSKLWRAHRLCLMQDGNSKRPKLYAHATAFSRQNIETQKACSTFWKDKQFLKGTWKPYIEKKVKRRIKLPFRFAEPPCSRPPWPAPWQVYSSQWTAISRSAHRAGWSPMAAHLEDCSSAFLSLASACNDEAVAALCIFMM